MHGVSFLQYETNQNFKPDNEMNGKFWKNLKLTSIFNIRLLYL